MPDPILGPILERLGPVDDPSERAALEWVSTTEEMFRRKSLEPQRLMLLHYEDLAESPREILPAVLRHIQVAPNHDLVEYAAARLVPPRPAPDPELRPEIQRVFDATSVRVRRHRESFQCE